MMPLGIRFFDVSSTFTSLGQIFGLVGMVLFSINLILAGKFRFLDKYFKGLDKVYANHSKLGSIAFSMILFHPLFLVVKFLMISTQEAAMFFVPFISPSVTFGIISLALMILLMSLTFYIKLKYNVWKFSHKFMVLAFVFGIIHTFIISSDVSRNNFLRYYILILAILGLVISVRQAFFNKTVKKFNYKVKNIKSLNPNVLEIEMEPIGEKILFKPGQFAFFSFKSEQVSDESHPFSIASSILDNNLRITIKNLGDYTSTLINLKINDGVLIDGPYGDFSYKKINNINQIWIAGGIGITPFLSMARSLERNYHVDMYYSVKENNEAVYLDDFGIIGGQIPNFKFKLWSANEKGYLNADAILNLSKDLASKDIFLCGPPVFMESLKKQFVLLGVDIKKIHYENFSF
jgi:predicted ferric reductase